ncbi:hypothetical protein IEQ34_006767 [Dendrobium chrysotoxum]|uniref:Uncharacterized protein n=1 Tax=Dendrobium chrysotoxum TaxID=161865 RepID=A0AAV7H4K4_DENCH|nr:hypothetical protein IEQ34_006767 [Dendrobium chrysotoxum]
MEEEGRMHTFKLQRSQSWLGCRWKTSNLLQDSLSQHKGAFMPMPGYERLSQSMRFFSEEPRQEKLVQRLRQGGWVRKVMGHVFFLHKVDGDRGVRKEGEGKEKERKKKRSSWLPDPERRWPLQGW